MAGPFPTSPINLDLHTTDGGTVYQYLVDHDRWVLYKEIPTFMEDLADDSTPQLGANLDLNAHGLIIDATPDATGEYEGTVLSINTTSCATYDLVYCDLADSVLPANAGAEGTMPVIGMCVGVGLVLTHGVIRNTGWTLTAGAIYYAETTAGDFIAEPNYPNATDDIVQVIGKALGTTQLFINPSLSYVMHG